ncbi:MAG TPA: radical SAM protein [Pseudobacteroides sp.]|nr:radical SAM protein [Pseudobacteroides sp.]
MKNILLINLSVKQQVEKFVENEVGYNPAIGLLSIATYMEMNGYRANVLDLIYEKINIDGLINKIAETSPILIGISAYTENYKNVLETAKQIKCLYGDVKIAVGGAHATLVPNDLIKSRYIDFVVLKEGEPTFLELAEAVSTDEEAIRYEDIDGLVFKRGKEINKNKYRKPIKDLDLLPIIKRELVDINRYNGTVNISTSRGCPANCVYCAATALSGATYRTRDVRNVFMEIVLIKHLTGDKTKYVYFVDDTFTGIKDRIHTFIRLMNEYKPDVKWSCESRIDIMTEELFKEMVESGCYSVQFGIESGNQEVLNKIRKNIDLKDAKRKIKYASQFDIEICLSFMLGHYCDTKETMLDTYKFIEEVCSQNSNIKIGVGFNTPFPGTWQFSHKDELGYDILEKDYSNYTLLQPVIETENFSRDDQLDVFMKIRQYQKCV